jgi:hypothetical protein
VEELAQKERTKPEAVERKCFHQLLVRDVVNDTKGRPKTVEFKVNCNIKHKKSTKNPTHKAVTGHIWK